MLVPRTSDIVKKGMFRKDSFMREVKGRRGWLGKALWEWKSRRAER